MAVKKLIEVALPLDVINAASAREKSIRHGHPSTLHLWWARRPLAAARAVIWASLVDDPSSYPEVFSSEEEQRKERERLFRILSDLVIWENSNSKQVLDDAKAEIRRCMGDEPISFLDPFAGGGAIPLEALRLGLSAHAHDLNPVSVTINKAMIEIPPRFAGKPAVNPESRRHTNLSTWERNLALARDVEYYGTWMRDEAYERLKGLYPQVSVPQEHGDNGATVIAWIWARTVKCPNPACGCRTPLVRSFDLSKKRGRAAHVHCEPTQSGLRFEVREGKSSRDGTVNRKGAVCIRCGTPIGFPYIRKEGASGRMGEELMAVVAEGQGQRIYLSPDESQANAAKCERPDDYPTCELVGKAKVNVGNYGFNETGDLFSNRQLQMLTTLCTILMDGISMIEKDAVEAGFVDDGVPLFKGGKGSRAYAEAITVYLAFLVDKLVDYHSSICSWHSSGEKMRNTFGRQAIPMVWDYAECNPFCNSSGSMRNMITWITKVIECLPYGDSGVAVQFDAQSDCGLREIMVSSDPPYYDNIDYADLSDYFYVWLRTILRDIYPELYRTISTPKTEELVASAFRDYGETDARSHFEEGMLAAFKQVYRYAREDVPVTIYYAFKQTSTETSNGVESAASTGWETMLSAIIKAGFSVTGTWPMRTEMSTRSVASRSNALASSIVLVCRKRPEDAPMATRREFVSALKRELKPALDKLQTSNIAPVDLAQSAIGPGIGVYSRYSKVLEADGSEMTVRSALQIINQELDLYFSDQDGDLDRDSRLCVELYSQSAFNEIRFGDADVLARAKNTSIEGIASKGALSSAKGVVRLLGRDEIRDIPAPDFCWLFTQQLTHAMEMGGVDASAKLLKDVLDSRGENARALAYRLFSIADKKGWNQEAFVYNSLVTAWREIESKAAALQATTPVQTKLDI